MGALAPYRAPTAAKLVPGIPSAAEAAAGKFDAFRDRCGLL